MLNLTNSMSHEQCPQQCCSHEPCGAALKPWTNFAEFSLKKRWRYMMRTSAWQPRFRTSTESLISIEKPSAAMVPRSASSSREKSFTKKKSKKWTDDTKIAWAAIFQFQVLNCTWRMKLSKSNKGSVREWMKHLPCQSVLWTEGGIGEANLWPSEEEKQPLCIFCFLYWNNFIYPSMN